jgi:3'-phosphoadenosine 5'-phosphosulfate sulfotransferase (PAPS reductase)/FAD synthetase
VSIIHVVSVSSGKDSTACALLALQRFGRDKCRFVFADTGNENQAVYEYLDYLELALEIKVERLRTNFDREIARKREFIARDQRTGRRNGRKVRWSNKAKRRALSVLYPSGNPYLDLCLWKGRFPSRKAQFCTEQLKTTPLVEYQMALIDEGHTVVSWQGIRRDESFNRRNAKKFERLNPGLFAYRPIVEWTAQQTVDYIRSQGIILNPLYSQGMTRVGCMPCINANKGELREIASRFPEEIARIVEWERLVGMCSKRHFSTFMVDSHAAKDRRIIFADLNILARVEWSKTTHGGRQRDIFAEVASPACTSAYGLCE